MGQFMSFTVGTKVYSLWLYMLGADVHPTALIFTRVADFRRVTVGADAIVCHGAALGTTRMLQVEGGGTAVSQSSVVVAPRSTVGYGSAVTCAETGDLSVSGALTSLPPDLQLPPRSLAIGSTPYRFEWHRDHVKQLDQSNVYAPDLLKDVVLPKTFQSNLLKTLRLRKQRLSSTLMEHQTVKCALVTGANGFLGRYITAELLKLEENPEVICFVRGKTEAEAKERLVKSLAEAGVSEARAFGPKGRVRVVCGDLGKELLGLDFEKFDELAANVTHIYHSGARVNHAEPYEHLRRENVWGTAKLLEFSVTRTLKEFHYVSTYSTTTVDMLGPDGFMSEEAPLGNIRTGLLGGSCELTGGYVFSKWTAEQLVILAGEEGAQCAIHRPGMIGGQSADGKSGDDNFVNFMNDIVRMGQIPRLVGSMFNTTPVDFVAYSIVHASRQPKTEKGVRRFHPIAKDSDLDSRDIYELLNEKGYNIRWCGFQDFRKQAKAQGDGMKSWLLVAGLTAEGHGLDSMAANRNSWEHMMKARGADVWRPRDTLSKMIDYLMSKGKLPLPSRPNNLQNRNTNVG
jgi:thioester reductase-like protein